MGNSPIRKCVQALHAYVPGEQPTDPAIIKLNTNENPYPPSPSVQALLNEFDAERLRLYPDPVCRELREVLAELHGCKAEQILVGNGSDEVLLLAIRAFVEGDQRVGYFEPSYSLYPVLSAIEDVETYEVPLDDEFGWVDPDPRAAALFFITNPNAPTSLLHSRERIASFCAASGGVVLVDEAYGDFAREHCMDLALSCDNVLVSRTVSKSYSLAGLRLGYVVGPEPLIAALYKIKDSYNVDRLAQDIATAAIRDQTYFKETVTRIQVTRERIALALREKRFEVAPSETNFLWVRPSDRDAAGLFERLREQKILVRYFPGARTGEWLRITVGTDPEMDKLLACL